MYKQTIRDETRVLFVFCAAALAHLDKNKSSAEHKSLQQHNKNDNNNNNNRQQQQPSCHQQPALLIQRTARTRKESRIRGQKTTKATVRAPIRSQPAAAPRLRSKSFARSFKRKRSEVSRCTPTLQYFFLRPTLTFFVRTQPRKTRKRRRRPKGKSKLCVTRFFWVFWKLVCVITRFLFF